MPEKSEYDLELLNEFRYGNIGRYFLRASRLYAEIALKKLAAYDHPSMGMTHLTIIRHIDLVGTRTTEIADRAGMTKQAVGKVVSELEANGYLIRVPDPADGRAQLVQFTDSGLQFLRDAREIKVAIETEFAGILGTDRFNDLMMVMSELLDHYQPS